MTTTATHKIIRLAAIATPAIALASTGGYFSWSDETLKQDVEPVEGSLAKLLSFKTQAIKVVAVAAPVVALASTGGFYGWSDETLKRDVERVAGSLERVRSL